MNEQEGQTMKLGIYGGTFNPPHLGHLTSARLALDALGLDALQFVPAATPPHKALPAGSPAPEERLAMVELAADGLLMPKRVGVSDMELLHAQYPGAELWLLMGTDMFLTLQYWREPEVITRLAGVCTFARTQSDSGEALSIQAEYLQKTFGARTCVLQLPQIVDVSSTQLRELLAKGEGQQYLPPAVYGYIIRRGLYGVHWDPARPGAAGLLLLHDQGQAHRPRPGDGGGGGPPGPPLGGGRDPRPPGGHPPRLHQVSGHGRAVAIVQKIWYRTG